MKKLFIIFCLLFSLNSLFAQFSVSYHFSDFSKIGVGYDFNKHFWSDVRILPDFRSFDEISVDISANWNILAKEQYDLYVGIGGLLNYDSFNGLAIPIGTRIRPFKKFDNFMFQIELHPAFNDIDYFIFSSFGIRYNF
jgi:hypothetical protein